MPGPVTIPNLEERIKSLKQSESSLLKKLREIRRYAEDQHKVVLDGTTQPCSCSECAYKRRLIEILDGQASA